MISNNVIPSVVFILLGLAWIAMIFCASGQILRQFCSSLKNVMVILMGIALNMYITFCTISIFIYYFCQARRIKSFQGLVSFFNFLFVVFSILKFILQKFFTFLARFIPWFKKIKYFIENFCYRVHHGKCSIFLLVVFLSGLIIRVILAL